MKLTENDFTNLKNIIDHYFVLKVGNCTNLNDVVVFQYKNKTLIVETSDGLYSIYETDHIDDSEVEQWLIKNSYY